MDGSEPHDEPRDRGRAARAADRGSTSTAGSRRSRTTKRCIPATKRSCGASMREIASGESRARRSRIRRIRRRQRQPPSQRSDSKIGRFRIVDELGRGGQAIVYRAEDPTLRRTVALKVLTVGAHLSENSLRRFRREAEIASRLDHPGICPVYDTGVDGGLTWIAMRCVEGETLARRIAAARHSKGRESVISDSRSTKSSRSRPALDVVRVVDRARPRSARDRLHGEGRAHAARRARSRRRPPRRQAGQHHGPARRRAGRPRLRPRAHRGRGATSLVTQTGDFLGTPSYMAPEQLAGPTELVDRRADVWGLGVTLYEALTLKRPFEDSTRGGLEDAIRSRDPSRVHRENSQVPRDLDAIVEKALEKNPRRRYATAAELADDLHRVLVHEPVKAKPAGPLLRTQRWVQRNPVPALLIVVLVAGLATALVLLQGSARETRKHRRRCDTRALSASRTRPRELLEADPDRALHVALEAVRSRADARGSDLGSAQRGRASPPCDRDAAQRHGEVRSCLRRRQAPPHGMRRWLRKSLGSPRWPGASPLQWN